MPEKRRLGRGALRTTCLVLILAGAALSFVPLLETNVWWVRYTDFIRLQLAFVLGASILLYLAAGGMRSRTGIAVAAIGVAGLGYHAYRLHPYLGIAETMVVAAELCTDNTRLSVMVANVQKSNENQDAFLAVAEAADPDLMLLLETDPWWDEAIAPIAAEYPHIVQHIPQQSEAFGMHLLSRLPLGEPEIVFWFDSVTPTILTDVVLPTGDTMGFVGLHPRPPLYWDQPTTLRDAHILSAALEASDSRDATIIAGDFNAVPWERITWRAMRIGSLLDPRVGRGIYPTYDAQSWIMSWPLDQILLQEEFALLEFERLPEFGSDHYPIMATICFAPDLAELQSAPALEPDDFTEAATALAAAREAK